MKEVGTAGTARTAPRLPRGSPPHTRSPHRGCQPPGTGHSPCWAAISAPEAQLFEPEQKQETAAGHAAGTPKASVSALTKRRRIRDRPHTDPHPPPASPRSWGSAAAPHRPQRKQEPQHEASETQRSHCFTADGQSLARSVLFQTKIDFQMQMTFYWGSKIQMTFSLLISVLVPVWTSPRQPQRLKPWDSEKQALQNWNILYLFSHLQQLKRSHLPSTPRKYDRQSRELQG